MLKSDKNWQDFLLEQRQKRQYFIDFFFRIFIIFVILGPTGHAITPIYFHPDHPVRPLWSWFWPKGKSICAQLIRMILIDIEEFMKMSTTTKTIRYDNDYIKLGNCSCGQNRNIMRWNNWELGRHFGKFRCNELEVIKFLL